MKNLINQTTENAIINFNLWFEELNKKTEVKEILDFWTFNTLIPKSNKKDLSNINDLKTYLIARKTKATAKQLKKQIDFINSVFNTTKEIETISISVEWKKSKMWGNNPTATVNVNFKDFTRNSFVGKASGCGYDKESAAIAEALNQCNELKKLLYVVKNENVEAKNQDIFGYGAGYGQLPYFESGVGTSCYNSIFEKIGFNFKKTAWGKTFDVYHVEKK